MILIRKELKEEAAVVWASLLHRLFLLLILRVCRAFDGALMAEAGRALGPNLDEWEPSVAGWRSRSGGPAEPPEQSPCGAKTHRRL